MERVFSFRQMRRKVFFPECLSAQKATRLCTELLHTKRREKDFHNTTN